MATTDTCTQCGSEYKICATCKEKIIYVPRQGFGMSGEWRHLEPPVLDRPIHKPHPELHIT